MLKPPRDAQEAFDRLALDLEEITDFIADCPLTARERARLAGLLSNYFQELAAEGVHSDFAIGGHRGRTAAR